MTDNPAVSRADDTLRGPFLLPKTRRRRHDGWLPERQNTFLLMLLAGGSVSDAAAAAGMSRPGAYRYRNSARGASFAAAWDAAIDHVQSERMRQAQGRLPQTIVPALEGLPGGVIRRRLGLHSRFATSRIGVGAGPVASDSHVTFASREGR